MKGIKTVPARSANFQPMAPFQHVVLTSNPLGIQKGVERKTKSEESIRRRE
jgi:hypothetical protein